MANELAINKISSVIVDYKNGAMAKNVKKSKYISHNIFEDGRQIIIPNKSIVIMQSILPFSIRPELRLSEKSKVFFLEFTS